MAVKPSFASLFAVSPSLTQKDHLFFATNPQIYQALDVIGGDDGGRFLFKHPHPDMKIDPRQHPTIAWLRKEGWTLQKIADRFGVTRQRIHQILKEQSKD